MKNLFSIDKADLCYFSRDELCDFIQLKRKQRDDCIGQLYKSILDNEICVLCDILDTKYNVTSHCKPD